MVVWKHSEMGGHAVEQKEHALWSQTGRLTKPQLCYLSATCLGQPGNIVCLSVPHPPQGCCEITLQRAHSLTDTAGHSARAQHSSRHCGYSSEPNSLCLQRAGILEGADE